MIQKKNAEFGVTITLPQASSTENVGRAAEGTTWNIKTLVEDADKKALKTINRTAASEKTVMLNFDKVSSGEKVRVRVCVKLTQEYQTTPSYTLYSTCKKDYFLQYVCNILFNELAKGETNLVILQIP